MSYRELRNFAEHMRALGYQRLVSVENFRSPNFELVASVLFWMVKRYDPEISVSDSIETEDDRVDFITNVVAAIGIKARIKLNAKKLYAADGRAVKELLKIASLLFEANRRVADVGSSLQIKVREETKGETLKESQQPLISRVKEIKEARNLATEITERGARLHDLLGREKNIKNERTAALVFLDAVSANASSSSTEHRRIEKNINEIITMVTEDIDTCKKQYEELQADERTLQNKIKKKQAEVERHDKRLRSLQTVRPAFMDEYERLENDLQKQYANYLERFRNLDYLQHELDAYDKAEDEKMKQSQKKLQKLRKKQIDQELKQLRGDFLHDDDIKHSTTTTTTKKKSSSNRGGAQGSMMAAIQDEDSDAFDDFRQNQGPRHSDSESVSIADNSGSDDVDGIDDDLSLDDDDDDRRDRFDDEDDDHSSTGEF